MSSTAGRALSDRTLTVRRTRAYRVLFWRFGAKRGQNGSKMEFFGSFSKNLTWILLLFGFKVDINVLHVC